MIHFKDDENKKLEGMDKTDKKFTRQRNVLECAPFPWITLLTKHSAVVAFGYYSPAETAGPYTD